MPLLFWKPLRFLLVAALLGIGLAACAQEPPEPAFRVVGYATQASIPDLIPYDQVTHINYSFLIPNADGTFEYLANGWKLAAIVERAHAAGGQVLISVGGWGWDAQFETVAADPALRQAFTANLLAFMEEYNLDGADIDWEYPDPGASAQNYLTLLKELRAALPEGKLLTTAVVAYGDEYGLGIPAEAFEVLDFVNLMAYDGAAHGTMAQAEESLNYWLGRGLPPEKCVLGLPFYSHPTFASYKKLVESDPAAAQVDSFEYLGETQVYNGIPTIQAKTRLALARASGVMFWTLDYDAQGEYSLVKAIDDVVGSE